MLLRLPKKGRPINVRYKPCALGVDLPAQFVYDMRGIDENFFFIFHPFRVSYDDIVNEYTGTLEDPRYPIVENSFKYGELVMGHVLSNGQEVPTPDGRWHVWRYCSPVNSWAHIISIESKDPIYLKLLVKRIWLQAQYNDKYGLGYQRHLEQLEADQRQKLQDERQDLMNEIHKANSAMVNRAMQNFQYGRVKPTRPQKEIIMSGPGLTNKSKITREITEKEAGLILPDD